VECVECLWAERSVFTILFKNSQRPFQINNRWESSKIKSNFRKMGYVSKCRLGGVVVSVLATRPKGYEFEPGQDDGFLRAIKIHSTPSFGWEVKLEVPCHEIL
jgi:hypothetical protein